MTRIQGGFGPRPADDWLLSLFCLAILGSAILPLVPVWTGATTAIAIVWLLLRPEMRFRAAVGTLLVATSAVYVAAWFGALVTSPSGLFIAGLVHYYGVPLGLTANGAQLAGQLLLVAALGAVGWRRGGGPYRLFLGVCGLFAVWGALSAVWNAATGVAEVPAETLAAAAIWAHWAALAIFGSLLLDSRAALTRFLRFIFVAGALIAASLLFQYLIRDFSYVLVTADSDALFARVRGSYYYHAPPVQYLAFAFPIMALMLAQRRRRVLVALVTIVIGLVLVLNGTRGISLAACAGVGAFGLFLMLTRGWRDPASLISLAMVAAIASGIVYVKPGYSVAAPPPQQEQPVGAAETSPASPQQPDASPALPATSTEVLESNSYRVNLARYGLNQVLQRPVLGLGPSNGQIVLPHNQSNQKRYELSSHILLVDLAMMGGIVSALAFAAIFVLPSIGTLIRLVRRPNSDEAMLYAGLLAALAVFGVSTLFHPQERSFIIATAVVLAGSLAGVMHSPIETGPVRTRLHELLSNSALAGLVLAMGGWLLLTSPNYVFPVIEFVARYRNEINANTPIYTTNATFTRMLGAGLRLAGVSQPSPRTLVDDPEQLPTGSGFIVWRPSDESAYPRIREALGPASPRRFGQWMSVMLPPSWTLVNNYQPNVQFLRVGAFPNVEVAVGASDGDAVSAGVPLELQLRPAEIRRFDRFFIRFDGLNQGNATIRWSYAAREGWAEKIISSGETVAIPTTADMTELDIRVESQNGGRVFVTGLLRSLPSIAHLAHVRMWVAHQEIDLADARKIADLLDQSDVSWEGKQQMVVEFVLPAPVSLSAYRILPQINGPSELPAPRRWMLEGLREDGDVVLLDQRLLKRAPPYELGFAIAADTEAFKIFRFVFPAGADVLLRIREIELYPADSGPSTTGAKP